MATPKQIEANRLNAQKSGLDAESQIVPGESAEEFAELQAQWYTYLPPNNPDERYQLDLLIKHEWFQRRFFRIEAQLATLHAKQPEQGTGLELGEGFHNSSTVSMRLHRRMVTSEKARKEARKELTRLRDAAPPPQAEETKAETQKSASFLTASPQTPTPSPKSPILPLELARELREIGILERDPGEKR